MQRTVIVRRIVAIVAVRRHLIRKPSIDAFIKMRRLDFNQPAAKEDRHGKDGDFRQTGFEGACGHPNGITPAPPPYQAPCARLIFFLEKPRMADHIELLQIGPWLSLVERLNGVQEVESSNLSGPIFFDWHGCRLWHFQR